MLLGGERASAREQLAEARPARAHSARGLVNVLAGAGRNGVRESVPTNFVR
jgi:hypothetical protein